jgi:uracil-DNA glycosylase
MDFYFPGKGPHGDLPPRADFAPTWHPKILANLPALQLTILIGRYAQAAYLGKSQKANLTETVKAFHDYLPEYFPLVHPSPLNFRWQAKNPWFATEVLPVLGHTVDAVLRGT